MRFFLYGGSASPRASSPHRVLCVLPRAGGGDTPALGHVGLELTHFSCIHTLLSRKLHPKVPLALQWGWDTWSSCVPERRRRAWGRRCLCHTDSTLQLNVQVCEFPPASLDLETPVYPLSPPRHPGGFSIGGTSRHQNTIPWPNTCGTVSQACSLVMPHFPPW